MYCPKCGKELPEGAYFCPNCGNSIIAPPTQPQMETGSDQDISATEQRSTPPAPQQSKPPIPDEEVKCPKCGATGCVPQYKQNVSGGGYGCCQGVLGSMILGPLGLLCGACGRSVKTTNNLVWICPKCGHEFRNRPPKNMKVVYASLYCAFGLMSLTPLFLALSSVSVRERHAFALFMLLADAIFCLVLYGSLYMPLCIYNDEEKQQLKKIIVIGGAISFFFNLIGLI